MIMKILPAAILATFAAGSAQAASFVNGGFENGDISGWVAGGGDAPVSERVGIYNGDAALTPANWLPGGTHYNSSNSNSAVISAGTVDPTQGALLGSTVYSGSYSYRVENTRNGGYASAIGQTVFNYTDSDIYFAWKAVLDGAHGPTEAATIVISLFDVTDNAQVISRIYNATSGSAGNAGQFVYNSNNGDYYTPDWQIEHLAITPALQGHTFTLSVLAADCQQTGHYGYVYLDGFGAVTPPAGDVPEPESLALVGVGLAALVAARRRKTKSI